MNSKKTTNSHHMPSRLTLKALVASVSAGIVILIVMAGFVRWVTTHHASNIVTPSASDNAVTTTTVTPHEETVASTTDSSESALSEITNAKPALPPSSALSSAPSPKDTPLMTPNLSASSTETAPRNPAREELAVLFERIAERRTNPPAPYESVLGKLQSRPERLAERAKLSQSNFKNLCADCHSLGNNSIGDNNNEVASREPWAADLGPGICSKIDCGDTKALSFYINRYMPPENPKSCQGACASDMALYVFHSGNDTLAALHQESPYLMLDANITIRNSDTGDVLMEYNAP